MQQILLMRDQVKDKQANHETRYNQLVELMKIKDSQIDELKKRITSKPNFEAMMT